MRTIQTSFSGGEISPEMFGNVADPRLRTGAATMRNFVARPSGAAVRRPGTSFVNEVKDSTKKVTLIPFRYSIDQTLCVQVGEGYFRFHSDGGTVLFATERRVASVDAGANTITFTAPHDFDSDDPIRLFSNGGTIMAGLTGGQTYYAIPTSTTTIQVSATAGPGAAENITGSGSGVQSAWLNSECPPLYVGSKAVTYTTATISATDIAGDFVTTSAAHGLTTGNAVAVGSTAGGLTTGVIYYAIVTDTDKLKFAATLADALAGTPVINLSGAVSATLIYGSRITVGAGHGLTTGDPVNHTVSGGTIIVGLTANTTYYAIVLSSTVYKIATTEANALAGTEYGVITGAGTGTTRFHYVYEAGDLVTNINAPQGFYHCRVRNPQDNTPGTVAYWYAMPFTGEFELPNSYVESNLPNIDYAQSNDVLRLAHPDHRTLDLRRLGATQWDVAAVDPAPVLDAPTGLAATANYGQGLAITAISATGSPITVTTVTDHNFVDEVETVTIFGTNVIDGRYVVYDTPLDTTFLIKDISTGVIGGNTDVYSGSGGIVQSCRPSAVTTETYKVTAVDANNSDSLPSDPLTVTNNLLASGASTDLTWNAVTGAVRYNVFRLQSGLYAYIGSTETTSFTDDNIDADASYTIPFQDETLTSANAGAVGFYNQRSIFAGFESAPQDVLTSRVGGYEDLSYHLPLLDTDRIAFRLTATSLCRVQYVVPLSQLLVMTDSAEFRIVPLNSEVLTPTTVDARSFSYVGCAKVKPQIVNNAVVFAAARGGHVFQAAPASNYGEFLTDDLCFRAAHLFDGLSVTCATQQKAPLPILWFVSSSGDLLGMTYVPGQDVVAWHRHDTDGVIEACCAVAEGTEDALYLVVKRTIDGSDVRYIERMEPFNYGTRADAFFVDCGLRYSGASATVISGLDHLEGETVDILADGKIQDQQVVTSGAITLGKGATKVSVGLPIVADLETPPWANQIEALAQGRTKNLSKAYVRLKDAGPFEVGHDADNLVPANATRTLTTGEVDLSVIPNWNRDGRMFLRVTDPLPCTVVGLTLNCVNGD